MTALSQHPLPPLGVRGAHAEGRSAGARERARRGLGRAAPRSRVRPGAHRAFTLIEVLVCVAIIALLVSILLPALGRVRSSARAVSCLSNQRQLIAGWHMYAVDFKDRAMPLGYWEPKDLGPDGQQIFWWGSHGTYGSPPDHDRGFIAPYLDASLRPASVFECAAQRVGTYNMQGPSKSITSTYGYNGYYLSPCKTPGWAFDIGKRPWQYVSAIASPTELLVFADTLLPPASANGTPLNTALLDPPMLFKGGAWTKNQSPTTAFRHDRTANASVADGSARFFKPEPKAIVHDRLQIGSVSADNSPWYVPDWLQWSTQILP